MENEFNLEQDIYLTAKARDVMRDSGIFEKYGSDESQRFSLVKPVENKIIFSKKNDKRSLFNKFVLGAGLVGIALGYSLCAYFDRDDYDNNDNVKAKTVAVESFKDDDQSHDRSTCKDESQMPGDKGNSQGNSQSNIQANNKANSQGNSQDVVVDDKKEEVFSEGQLGTTVNSLDVSGSLSYEGEEGNTHSSYADVFPSALSDKDISKIIYNSEKDWVDTESLGESINLNDVDLEDYVLRNYGDDGIGNHDVKRLGLDRSLRDFFVEEPYSVKIEDGEVEVYTGPVKRSIFGRISSLNPFDNYVKKDGKVFRKEKVDLDKVVRKDGQTFEEYLALSIVEDDKVEFLDDVDVADVVNDVDVKRYESKVFDVGVEDKARSEKIDEGRITEERITDSEASSSYKVNEEGVSKRDNENNENKFVRVLNGPKRFFGGLARRLKPSFLRGNREKDNNSNHNNDYNSREYLATASRVGDVEYRSRIDVYDGDKTVIYNVSRIEGERQLSELPFKHDREDVWMYVEDNDGERKPFFVDVGGRVGNEKMSSVSGVESPVVYSDSRYIKDVLDKFAEPGDSLTFYHFHPDNKNNRKPRLSVPSALDLDTHYKNKIFFGSVGYKVEPSRVVGSFADIEYDYDGGRDVRKLEKTISQLIEEKLENCDNKMTIKDRFESYMESMKGSNSDQSVIRYHN